MNRLRSALLLLCLWGACAAHAAIDCAAPTLGDQSVADFLADYSEACAEPAALAQKKTWQLPDGKVADYGELLVLRDVWADLAASFQTAAQRSQGPATRAFGHAIQLRAKLTASDFAHDMQAGILRPKALYRSTHWSTDHWLLQAPADGEGHSVLPDAVLDLSEAVQQDCADLASSTCQSAVRSAASLSTLWVTAALAAQTISDASIQALNAKVQQDNQDWQRFLDEGKTMLPLDFVLTDWLEARHYRDIPEYADGQVAPPQRQWFLLHPAVAMENVANAPDGQQFKPILQLELIGVNWWRPQDRPFADTPWLKAFSGVSLMATYADRSGVKDTGVGLLLVFNNSFTLGISRYGHQTGISLSVDLLDALKRNTLASDYEDLRKRFNQLARPATAAP